MFGWLGGWLVSWVVDWSWLIFNVLAAFMIGWADWFVGRSFCWLWYNSSLVVWVDWVDVFFCFLVSSFDWWVASCFKLVFWLVDRLVSVFAGYCFFLLGRSWTGKHSMLVYIDLKPPHVKNPRQAQPTKNRRNIRLDVLFSWFFFFRLTQHKPPTPKTGPDPPRDRARTRRLRPLFLVLRIHTGRGGWLLPRPQAAGGVRRGGCGLFGGREVLVAYGGWTGSRCSRRWGLGWVG